MLHFDRESKQDLGQDGRAADIARPNTRGSLIRPSAPARPEALYLRAGWQIDGNGSLMRVEERNAIRLFHPYEPVTHRAGWAGGIARPSYTPSDENQTSG